MRGTKANTETVVLTLRIPKELYERIKEQADLDARSMNSYVGLTLDRVVPETR